MLESKRESRRQCFSKVNQPLPLGQVKYLTPLNTPSVQVDCSSSFKVTNNLVRQQLLLVNTQSWVIPFLAF